MGIRANIKFFTDKRSAHNRIQKVELKKYKKEYLVERN